MRVMVFAKATEDSEMGVSPTPETTEVFEAMGRFNEELVKAGVMLAGDGLKPAAQGKRMRSMAPAAGSSTGRSPRPASWSPASRLWEVKDMDEAVAWAKRCPNPMPGPSEIEIRPFYEAADLAEFLTPDAARGHRVTGPDRREAQRQLRLFGRSRLASLLALADKAV